MVLPDPGKSQAAGITLILVAMLAIAGCAHRHPALPAAPAIVDDESLFRSGQAAFQEFTPEGYLRASDLFRKALALKPARCDYKLHLAESLLFLAYEQKWNHEEFAPRHSEALALVDSSAGQAGCEGVRSLVLRLNGLSKFPDFGGLLSESRSLIDAAIDADPNDAMNWLVRWMLIPGSRRGESDLDRIAELGPGLALSQYALGTGLRPSAVTRANLEKAIEISPRHFRSYLALAEMLPAVDDTVDVVPLYLKAIEIAPAFLYGRLLFGNYYADIAEDDKAMEQYRFAISANPAYADAHLGLGIVLLFAGRTDEAERSFIETIRLNPESYKAYYYYGNLWFARNDFERAKAQYGEALKLAPGFAEANFGMGSALEQQGRIDDALDYYDRAIRSNSSYADPYLARANIRFDRRQFADARTDYVRAIQLYEAQLQKLKDEIRAAQAHGLARKVSVELKQLTKLEAVLQTAQQSRVRAEALAVPKPYGMTVGRVRLLMR